MTRTLLAICITFGCAPPQLATAVRRQRNYEGGEYAQRDPALQPANGSLFSEANAGYLEDTRALHVGDIVVVRIDETTDARGTTHTELGRDSRFNFGMGEAFGLMSALRRSYPDFDPSQMLAFASRSGYAGNGETTRNGQLRGQIAVRVVRAMPNGDLYLEGTKLILVNNEELHLYLSGVVRRADIAPDNTVVSSRIADADIEVGGRGDLSDQNRRGWLHHAIDNINPF